MTIDLPEMHAVSRKCRGRWVKDTIGVLYVVDDQVQFSDDFEHLAHGFCRLLEVSEEQVAHLIEEWVEQSLENSGGKLPSLTTAEEKIENLQKSAEIIFPVSAARLSQSALTDRDTSYWGADLFGNQADRVYAGSISGNTSRAVVGNTNTSFAWLVDPIKKTPVSANSIEYDTAYFDNRPDSHYGMKKYLHHTDWRMQKARRLIRHLLDVSEEKNQNREVDYSGLSLLDIGSATGLFRAACGELGIKHYGIDLSADAIEHCRNQFGFETWHGSIFDLGNSVAPAQKFNIITFWDVIEHLDRHIDAIRYVSSFLDEGGIIVVRTPNLEAIEATILGDMYYSYKLDHTSYFSVTSLDALFASAGLVQIHAETVSHIFKGCLGVQYLYDIGKKLGGADILAIYARPQARENR